MDRKLDRDWEKDNVIYPDPAIEVISDEFKKYVIGNGYIERIYTGSRWAEGPAWFGDGKYLLFSDIPNNRIIKWEENNGTFTTFRYPSNNANGNATRNGSGEGVVEWKGDGNGWTKEGHDVYFRYMN